MNVVDSQEKEPLVAGLTETLQEPLAAAVTDTVVPNVHLDFADSMPGPPMYEDKGAIVLDNRRRNPKRKGRPNEFVMREQLDSTSENESKRSSDASSSSDDGSVYIPSKSSSRSTKVYSNPIATLHLYNTTNPEYHVHSRR
jgi:hypothetical protein